MSNIQYFYFSASYLSQYIVATDDWFVYDSWFGLGRWASFEYRTLNVVYDLSNVYIQIE